MAELTGGVFFCHILFVNLVRSALYTTYTGAHLPWPVTVSILHVGPLAAAIASVALALRTPLRWVLTGPVRSEQRERINAAGTHKFVVADPGGTMVT